MIFIHPNTKIIPEGEKDRSFNFLDLTISIVNNIHQFSVFYKQFHTGITIPWQGNKESYGTTMQRDRDLREQVWFFQHRLKKRGKITADYGNVLLDIEEILAVEKIFNDNKLYKPFDMGYITVLLITRE